jgi:gluconate 2-dehydrogenase gamma chain
MRISRRSLLRNGTLIGGGLWLAGGFPFPRAARAAAASTEPEVLSSGEWTTLEAVTARLIPTDHEPGAREAGCVNFIDKVLANEEAAVRPQYASGLVGIDAVAQALHGLSFAELAADAQDAVLVQIDAGSARGWPVVAGSSAEFFEMVRVHTLTGFLADPRYGGNKSYSGWRVAGYPGPRHGRGGYTVEQVTGEAPIRPIWDNGSKG